MIDQNSTLEVPAALTRTTNLIQTLEDMVKDLEKRLTAVLSFNQQPQPDQKNQAPAPANPVPLAGDVDNIALRIQTLINAHRNILDRLHV